jgi:CoA:oxalate CoA-transferase
MTSRTPYKDIRVVDISHVIAGPYCAMTLARMGADVVKVEAIDGDFARNVGIQYPGKHTDLSIAANLGKRSIAVDLKSKEGGDILKKLVSTADVFIENFRPGVADKLGFSYEEVAALNDRIIYLSSSGWGAAGPYRERPGTDTDLQAFSGFMSKNLGTDGVPIRSQLLWVDFAAALYNVQAIQAALWERQFEGHGTYINNSLLETSAAFQSHAILNSVLRKSATTSDIKAYPFGNFRCADGYVQITVLRDEEFRQFMKLLGLAELGEDSRLGSAEERFHNRELIDQPIKDAMEKLNVDDICTSLADMRMLHARINKYEDFLEHEQTRDVEAFFWTDHPDVGRIPLANIPGTDRLMENSRHVRAPRLGEHTREILKELNYTDSQVQELSRQLSVFCDSD